MPYPQFSSNHVVLVTGASLGIGAETAVEFARRGAKVAVHYNSSKAQAEEVAARIEKFEGKAWLFQADVSDPDQARDLSKRVLETCGRVDTLVNNAGSLVERRPFLELTDDLWRKIIDINVSSVIWVSQSIARHMKERGSGSIINLGSIAGHNGGGPGAMPYATSKAAVTCMTKLLATS